MPIKNTRQAFGYITKWLHWLSALIVLGLLLLGFWMTTLPYTPFKLEIYALHKSFGITIIALTLIRASWKIYNAPPPPLQTHTKTERIAAKTIHRVLYISLLAMPISGWVMSSSGNFPNNFFGLWDLPNIAPKNEEIFEISKQVHELIAYILIASIALHIIGAIKHHIIDKDTTLKRMGGNLTLAGSGLLILLGALSFTTTAPQETKHSPQPNAAPLQETTTAPNSLPQWTIDPENSSINFTYNQYGQNITGSFSTWSGEIYFDSKALNKSSAHIRINTDSIKTGSTDRDQQARNAQWFNTQKHPHAIFKSESFEKTKPNHYRIKGHLTLRGIKLPVEFPFTLDITNAPETGQQATMRANLILNRLDYGIGQDQWSAPQDIKNPVEININLNAKTTR